MSAPLFSIVIPAYNCAQYIQQTLRSIYQQTVQDYEIIVINDGSPDDLEEVLKKETDPRLRIITQPNGGVSRARNRGIQEAKGSYIAFLDSDDVWLPFHLEKAKIFFESYPQYHWYATKIKYVKTIHDEDFSNQSIDRCNYYASNWFLEFATEPITQTAVVKREYATKHLLFPPGIKIYEDNLAWSKLAIQLGAIGTIDYPTSLYRVRQDSAMGNFHTSNREAKSEIGKEVLCLQQNMLQEYNCPKEAHEYFEIRALYYWIQELTIGDLNQRLEAVRNLRSITGKLSTLFLYVHTQLARISNKILKKILEHRFKKMKNRLAKRLKKAKQLLNH